MATTLAISNCPFLALNCNKMCYTNYILFPPFRRCGCCSSKLFNNKQNIQHYPLRLTSVPQGSILVSFLLSVVMGKAFSENSRSTSSQCNEFVNVLFSAKVVKLYPISSMIECLYSRPPAVAAQLRKKNFNIV